MTWLLTAMAMEMSWVGGSEREEANKSRETEQEQVRVRRAQAAELTDRGRLWFNHSTTELGSMQRQAPAQRLGRNQL